VGRQHLGPVRKAGADVPPPVLIEDDGANLRIPEDLKPLTLGVIGNTGKTQSREIAVFSTHFFD
jgi:hypothetical protein